MSYDMRRMKSERLKGKFVEVDFRRQALHPQRPEKRGGRHDMIRMTVRYKMPKNCPGTDFPESIRYFPASFPRSKGIAVDFAEEFQFGTDIGGNVPFLFFTSDGAFLHGNALLNKTALSFGEIPEMNRKLVSHPECRTATAGKIIRMRTEENNMLHHSSFWGWKFISFDADIIPRHLSIEDISDSLRNHAPQRPTLFLKKMSVEGNNRNIF